MNDDKKYIIATLVITAIIVILSALITKGIVNSDLPLWLKVYLLR